MKLLIAASIALAPLPAMAAPLIVGGPGSTGDCAPFGCVIRYQQAYSASLFSGPLTIRSLSFFNDGGIGSNIAPATYTFTLSTSANPVGSLSTTFADNIGGDAAVFAVVALSGNSVPFITISGTPFAYDPADGDLLLDVTKSQGNFDFSAYFRYRGDFAGFQRVYAFDSTTLGSTNFDYGLVTGFNGVPEPGSWAMLIAGFGLVGAAARRRRAVAAA